MAAEIWAIFLRTVFVYFLIFLMMRLMGKREVGKLSTFDLVVSFMIADISSIALEELDRSLWVGLVPIFTIVALQVLLSFVFLKFGQIRRWVEGKPSIIINKGKIDKEAMAKTRYNIDDLLMQLREKSISDIRDVEYAILETSGKLSVFQKNSENELSKENISSLREETPFRLPLPLVMEGKVLPNELKKMGKDDRWLKRQLKKQGIDDIRNVFYASVNQQGEFYIDVYPNR